MIDHEKMKLVSNLVEKLTAFFPTDDNRLDQDYLWEQAKIIRNIFIEKLFGESRRNVEDFYSRLTIDVLDYDNTEQAEEETDADFNARYEPDIPSLKRIRLPNLINMKDNIRFMGPVDRSDEYVRTNFDSFFRLSGRDFTSDRVFYLVFHDRAFFSSIPQDSEGTAYTELMVWALLEDPEDDPNFSIENDPLVPKKYQLLLEDMIVDNVLKYARQGILSRENDATDVETIEGR
jgi:hypothetical protein